nr:DUF11 domain-containing protein [Paenibacillus sp. 23TSA30-6]
MLELIKNVNTADASVGDTLTFTVQITNKGDIPALYPLFTDPLPQGLIYVPNSLTIQEEAQSGANPGTGTNLPDIAPGETVILTLQAQIREAPVDGTFSNQATIAYTSRRSGGETVQETAQSNTVGVTVIAAIPKLTLSSSATCRARRYLVLYRQRGKHRQHSAGGAITHCTIRSRRFPFTANGHCELCATSLP